MQNKRYTVEVAQARGVNAVAYVYDTVERWNDRVFTGEDAVSRATATAAALNTPIGLPDPNVKGPCRAQATFMCTGEARGERLHPLSMLPDSKIPADYVPMCPECHDHLADMYVNVLHGRPA